MMKVNTNITAAFLLSATVLLVLAGPVHATSSAPDVVNVVDDQTAVQPVVPDVPNTGANIVTNALPENSGVSEQPPGASPVIDQAAPVVSGSPAPGDAGLGGPDASLSTPETGVSAQGSPLGDTGVQTQHSGQYYDSTALVPDSELEKAGVTGPRKVDPLYEPGQKFITVERSAGASSYEGQYVAATRALKLGRYAAAMEMFENLYKKNHKEPRVLMGLAVAQQGAGFIESAARSYEELLSVDPDNADATVNLMGIMKSQYPAVTLQNLIELRGKYPANPGIPAQIGMVNAEMQNYDDAVRYLEIAASMDPTNASHIYNMAIIKDRKGDIRGAMALYQRALELDSAYADNARALPREQIYDRLSTLRQKV